MAKRFEYKLNLGKDMNGRMIRKSFYSTKSKADAKRRAEAYRVQYELEICVGGSGCIKNRKFAEWAMYAIETYKKPFVKGNTYAGTYLEPVKNHLIPYFGGMNMDDIKPLHVQKYINEASKQYAPETVKKDYNILKLVFETAVDNQVCSKSPIAKSIKLPKHKTVREKSAYSQEQYNTAYAFAQQYENGLSIMLMLETGISRSELLGLRWSDLDIENRAIRINQGLVAYRSEDEEKYIVEADGLKNKFRQRVIPITDDTLWNRLCQAPRVINVGKSAIVCEYIIHSPEGHPYQPNNWANRVFRPFMKELHRLHPDIPELSPHELRHTRATLWIAQGMEPYMVARLLGHSDLKMLTKIYDHISTETLRNALKKVQDHRKTIKREGA